MPTVSESIGKFLRARATDANRDLIERWTPAMETQINVLAGNGEPVDGKRNTWTDGHSTWHHIRMPKNADTRAEPGTTTRLASHLTSMRRVSVVPAGTGRRRYPVGSDSTSTASPATQQASGSRAEELDRIRAVAETLPYVEVRRSTGGKGLHFYVYFLAIPTANHTEHAALARCILGMMSSATGFDFASQIDACGGNMWVWHRKMSADNHGLEIIKKATQVFPSPICRRTGRTILMLSPAAAPSSESRPLKDENEDPFETLASSRRLVPLDESHKAIIEELTHSGYSTVWVPDYHLLQTHTKALKTLTENSDLGSDLKIKGVFKTISEGKHPETCNCFCFPLDNGAWRVYRFSPGVPEAETWTQDTGGWTNCYFNKPTSLDLAARMSGGQEAPNDKGYAFANSQQAETSPGAARPTDSVPEALQGS